MNIRHRVQDIVKRFQHFANWEDRYRQLIHYGRMLAPMDKALKTPDRLVPGCVSKVWLHHEQRDGQIFFAADSDAAITKGIIGVLLHVYSGANAQEILQTPADFLQQIGLTEHLSGGRRNGLASMERLIQNTAASYLQTPDA